MKLVTMLPLPYACVELDAENTGQTGTCPFPFMARCSVSPNVKPVKPAPEMRSRTMVDVHTVATAGECSVVDDDEAVDMMREAVFTVSPNTS